jgi:RNA polymerase sigma factor (TIGR02999 family)
LLSPELRASASTFLRHERKDHTLQPTALVLEADLRLIDKTVVQESDLRRCPRGVVEPCRAWDTVRARSRCRGRERGMLARAPHSDLVLRPSTQTPDPTRSQLGRGDDDAAERLFPVLSAELRAIASSFLRQERPDHTLQPTALVHEAYVRLIDKTAVQESDRQRFLGLAARAMRQVLVDHARRRGAQRRGGDAWARVTLEDDIDIEAGGLELVELSDLLDRFESLDPRACRVVEMRFFAGLSFAEIASVLELTERTIYKDWAVAKTWLARELRGQRAE